MLEIIKHLSSDIGPRGAGSEKELEASKYIYEFMKSKGIKAEIKEFKTLPTFSYTYIFIYLFTLISLILGLFFNILISVTLIIFLIILYFLEEELYFPILTKFLCNFGPSSMNIIGKINEGKDKKIAIVAHYDSTKASYIFHPSRVKNLGITIKLNFISEILILIFVILSFFSRIFLYFAFISSIPIIISLAVLIHRELFHDYVPGANDNASGVAVMLSLIDELKEEIDKEIWFIATGSEESGMIGMYNILNELKYFKIINIDNIGAAKLRYCEEEGVLIKYKSKGNLMNLAKKYAKEYEIEPVSYSLLPTDATPALKRGFDALTIIALDERGIPLNYHWYNDTLEYIEEDNLKKVKDFVLKIIKEL